MDAHQKSTKTTWNAFQETPRLLSEELHRIHSHPPDLNSACPQIESLSQDYLKTNYVNISSVGPCTTSTDQIMEKPGSEHRENVECGSANLRTDMLHDCNFECNTDEYIKDRKHAKQINGKSEVSGSGDAYKCCNSSTDKLETHFLPNFTDQSTLCQVIKNENLEAGVSLHHSRHSISDCKSLFNTDVTLQNYTEISSITADPLKNKMHSTTSLVTTDSKGQIVNKILSRSAENLSTTHEKKSGIELDTDRILAEFDVQKSKASNVSTFLTISPCEHEHKSPRTNKEIITQDLGSIVKNVHGIFSSMSGSIKHAYNISQRVPVQPINKLLLETTGALKNTVNGKVRNVESNDIPAQNTISPDTSDVIKTGPEKINSVNTELSVTDPDKLESLEGVLLRERQEIKILRDKIKQQSDEQAEKDKERKDLLSRIELLTKRLELSEKEKDNAVMRYAVSESAVIGTREAAEAAKRGEKTAKAEMELLSSKLKSAHAEKQRICQIYDDKCHELATSEREASKLKEELAECQGRLKWTQNKLRTETEAYREAIGNVEKLNAQVSQMQSEKDAAASNNADAARLKQYECELKETRASLILRQHEGEELERKLTSTTQHLESCRAQLDAATTSLSSLSKKVSELEVKNEQLEQEAAELAPLRARAALADALSQQLERERERAARAEGSAAAERARADTCARREASALEHAARLQTQHVGERCVAADHHTAARALSADNAALRDRISTLESAATESKSALARETAKRVAECRLLAAKVAELTSELQQARQQLEWEKGESQVLRKKHATTVKELNRELTKALKRCETLEARAVSEQPDHSTPTGSTSSLCSEENGGSTAAPSATDDTKVNGHARTDSASDTQAVCCTASGPLPERQALIERVVQLQRACARRAERVDFLEEHARQLTAELAHKTRLLREVLLAQPAGALSDSSADRHKNRKLAKAEMARLGGSAMAALYGGASDAISLDLSLEINRRLQAVLEDTILKNITLKRNMDTLGEEIARLKSKGDKT